MCNSTQNVSSNSMMRSTEWKRNRLSGCKKWPQLTCVAWDHAFIIASAVACVDWWKLMTAVMICHHTPSDNPTSLLQVCT